MNLQPKNEIYRRIGTNSVFKKKLKTKSILSYNSGINELNHLNPVNCLNDLNPLNPLNPLNGLIH